MTGQIGLSPSTCLESGMKDTSNLRSMINHYSIICCMGHSHDLHNDKLYEYRIPIIADDCIVEQSGFRASISHIHLFSVFITVILFL